MSRKKLTKPVLAEGEVTGHAHVLEGNVDVFETDDGLREFNLSKSTKLNHQEHGAHVIEAGKYISGRVMEYDHAAEEAKRVQD
jgi:hypothetical protein